MEGAGETPSRPCPTQPVDDGTRPTPPYAVACEAFPSEPTCCPALQPATHVPRGWAHPCPTPPFCKTRGAHHGGAGPLARAPGDPPAPARRHDPQRPGAGPGGHLHTPLRGSARAPPPPPGARGAGLGARLRADPGGHRRHRGVPPAIPDDPRGPKTLSPALDWELWCGVWAKWLACLPPGWHWMATGP